MVTPSVLVMARSAWTLTVVVVVLELFPGVESVVAVPIVAVLLTTVPDATEPPTLTTRVKLALPGARLAMDELT